MKRFMFAAAGVLFASVALADDQPTTGSTASGGTLAAPVITGTTMPMTGTAVYSSSTSSSRRMGLFARLRGGRTSSSTMMAAPMAPATTVIMPSTDSTGTGTSIPSLMPTTMATPAVTGQPIVVAGGPVTSTMVMPAGGRMGRNGRVVQTSGTTMMVSDGTVQATPCDACGAQPMMATMTTSTNQRMGLIARMRMR